MPLDVSRYRVRCRCGAAAEGPRSPRPQVIPCPACRARLFIYPGGAGAGSAAPSTWWRGPAVAAGLSVLALTAILAVALPFLARKPPAANPVEHQARLEAGRTHMARGRFHLAAAALDGLSALPPDQARDAAQLRRQALLLSNLSPLPLDDVVRQARFTRDPEEWAAAWAAEHNAKGVVFDDVLRRDAEGRPVFTRLALAADGEPIRIALEDVRVLRDVPLDNERLIFGVRLARCERQEGGGWVIRLDTDSGVLFTDRDAVAAAFPVDLGPDVGDVLTRQAAWLTGRSR